MLQISENAVSLPMEYRSNDERAQAFASRDARADGCFVVAVKTTGIYCRPICPARPPKRKNIEFFDDVSAARKAGYRACFRCKPDEMPLQMRLAQLVTMACRRLETEDDIPRVAVLAKDAGLSESRFHRLFKTATGLSPKQYALARRVEIFRDKLKRGDSVTAAIYDSGFNSSGRAYEAGRRLGARPGDVRSGGEALTLRFGAARCSLGYVGIGMSERGLCALAFGESAKAAKQAVQGRFPKAKLIDGSSEQHDILRRVVAMVEEPRGRCALPLDIQGTVFQERVWRELQKIPPGETRSYAQVARAIGKPKAHRAVAQACGANKIAVAIPCHRVVEASGGLGGYAFGIKRKKALLEKESAS